MPRKNSKTAANIDPLFDTSPERPDLLKEWGEHLETNPIDTTEETDDDIRKVGADKVIQNKMIPLMPLRMEIAELQRNGMKKVPLGYLLNLMHEIYKEDQDGES